MHRVWRDGHTLQKVESAENIHKKKVKSSPTCTSNQHIAFRFCLPHVPFPPTPSPARCFHSHGLVSLPMQAMFWCFGNGDTAMVKKPNKGEAWCRWRRTWLHTGCIWTPAYLCRRGCHYSPNLSRGAKWTSPSPPYPKAFGKKPCRLRSGASLFHRISGRADEKDDKRDDVINNKISHSVLFLITVAKI